MTIGCGSNVKLQSDIFYGIKAQVDVMMANFCDFVNFWQKIGVFLKTQCYDQIFA
jgi:hypothetical protein